MGVSRPRLFWRRLVMVGVLDPGDDREPELLPGLPAAPVEDILLQQREERLHRGGSLLERRALRTVLSTGSWSHSRVRRRDAYLTIHIIGWSRTPLFDNAQRIVVFDI